jgi:rubrerythrin
MQEGSPEIAKLFMEAAGAETTHALNHLKVIGVVKSIMENIREAAEEENYEIEEMYPRFVKGARSEGRDDAVKSFELVLEREKYHREMFREALRKLG